MVTRGCTTQHRLGLAALQASVTAAFQLGCPPCFLALWHQGIQNCKPNNIQESQTGAGQGVVYTRYNKMELTVWYFLVVFSDSEKRTGTPGKPGGCSLSAVSLLCAVPGAVLGVPVLPFMVFAAEKLNWAVLLAGWSQYINRMICGSDCPSQRQG